MPLEYSIGQGVLTKFIHIKNCISGKVAMSMMSSSSEPTCHMGAAVDQSEDRDPLATTSRSRPLPPARIVGNSHPRKQQEQCNIDDMNLELKTLTRENTV